MFGMWAGLNDHRVLPPRTAVLGLLLLTMGACGGGGGGGGGGGAAGVGTPDNAVSTFTVTATAGPGGTVTPQSRSLKAGGTATFEVMPDTGHTIATVTGCDGTLDGTTYTTGPLNSACTISVTFALNSYTVSASAAPNGTIIPAAIESEHGTAAEFTVLPNPGYLVDTVSGCGGQLTGTSYVTAPITAACAVVARFRLPSVSGIVRAAPGSDVDSDVNHPNASYAPNDLPDEAQQVRVPVTLGGYVNEALSGPQGRSFDSGDQQDLYRTQLQAGQTIVLQVVDASADLDLVLSDLDGNVIDASVGTSSIESLTVAEDGEYLVGVVVATGASRYLLTIDASPAVARTERLSDDFVAGEVRVRFRPQSASARPAGVTKSAPLASVSDRPTQWSRVVALDALRAGTSTIAAAGARRHTCGTGPGLTASDPIASAKLETLCALKRLRKDESVVAAEPNYVHRLQDVTFTPNDALYPNQWHFEQIGLPSAWVQSTGQGTIIGILDTGVLLEHPDLEPQLLPGYDFLLGQQGASDPSGDSHGTRVAGIAAAATNNGLGVAGVAFGAQLLPLRVCFPDACLSEHIEQALRFAAGLPNASGLLPDRRADVVNLSFARDGPPSVLEQRVYDELKSAGVVVVAGAGNDDGTVPHYPAAYDGVIGVGAVNIEYEKAYYSNFGPWVDVVAPGGDFRDVNRDGLPDGVLTTSGDEGDAQAEPGYGVSQGTSMATPHVAGVVALMRAVAPNLGPADVETMLRNGAMTLDIGALGRDDVFGHGLIHAPTAVAAAIATEGHPVVLQPALGARPQRLDFAAGVTTRTVVLENIGGPGIIELNAPFGGADWLSFEWDGASVLDDGVSEVPITFAIDRSHLEPGVYTATVTVPSSRNTVEIEIVTTVPGSSEGNVGFQYVLLADPDRPVTRFFTIATDLGGGAYQYSIDDVEPGTYRLMSGTDLDNDNVMCDEAESCGFYPSEGETIEVGAEDLSGLDVTSGY